MTAGFPTASMQTSAPLPPVSALIASTGSVAPASTVWVAPNERGQLELPGVEVDGDDGGRPGELRPGDGGAPDAAAAEDRHRVAQPDLPGVHGRADARHHAAAEQPDRLGPGGGVDLRALPGRHQRRSAKAPMPSAGESGVPSASVIFCVALCVAKQYHGRPRRHARHSPHTARQFRTTKSPGARSVTSAPTDFDDTGGLVAQQEREVVVDPTLAVVQVRVAHPARLDADDRLAGPGIGHDDRLERDRCALRHRHHTARLAVPCRAPPRRRAHMMPDPGGSARCHEDAEGVPVRVGVHEELLGGVVGAVEEKAGPQGQRAFVLEPQCRPVGDGEVEVQLLGRRRRRASSRGSVGDLLEGDPWCPGRMGEDEPVPPPGVVVAGRRHLVAGLALVAQQPPVELGQPAGVGTVEDDLPLCRPSACAGRPRAPPRADDAVQPAPRTGPALS